MCLVAEDAPGLLRRRAVVAQSVGLDDELEVGPPEVHCVAVDVGLSLGLGKTGPQCNRDEKALELAGREDEGVAVEDLSQWPCAWPAGSVVELPPKPVGIDEVELVRLVDGGFPLAVVEARGYVDEGARGARDRDAFVLRHVLGDKGCAAVDTDAGAPRGAAARHGDLDLDPLTRANTPQSCGREMT